MTIAQCFVNALADTTPDLRTEIRNIYTALSLARTDDGRFNHDALPYLPRAVDVLGRVIDAMEDSE